ncbi:MAG: metal ABC transporter substrate-binding protein [Thiothrix sp.]|nr:MAG: metal ABC transporter substrate-binding protein [Thiothrix sp.]
MLLRRLTACLFICLLTWLPWVHAEQPPLKVVATFSILGDMVKAIGKERIQVHTLVGADSDAHLYQPTPADTKTLVKADILFINGLGFEGWLERLIEASGYQGKVITATAGITPLSLTDGSQGVDPHAWQNIAYAKTYIHNITHALQAADPVGSTVYASNRDAYLQQLTALEQQLSETLGKLPNDRRTVVTSHDAFAYFAAAYQLKFLAPQGISTAAEATAKEVAALIEQIRTEKITAIFLENMVTPRLLEQIAAESGATIGGSLYADALSPADGVAATYLTMMQHNIQVLHQALAVD